MFLTKLRKNKKISIFTNFFSKVVLPIQLCEKTSTTGRFVINTWMRLNHISRMNDLSDLIFITKLNKNWYTYKKLYFK